ncbi:uncharacterized protein LOC122521022 [Polistes fuscatus]|uniref:uncharacterized protein LOC122521022 n=1 Tax=Polistes fuscatus TaxID=30207 RepID=UPI001CA9CAEC|nr:uncharacterized protein LOC122521022 [Polistes fuscatus]
MEDETRVQIEQRSTLTTEKTLRVITYVSWFLGVGVAHPKKLPKFVTIIVRVLNFGVCTVIVAYGAIDFFTFGTIFKSDIFKIMYYMNKVVCYISSYYYVFHGIKHYEKWPLLMDKIEQLNKKITREVSINERSIKTVQILAVMLTFILGPVSLLMHVLYYYFTSPEDIFASDLLLYYTIAQSIINSFVFDTVVYVICNRFRKINKMIERLDNKLVASLIAFKIRRIRELHSDVCKLVVLVNDTHGVQLLLCSANSFIMVLATLFRIYMGVVEHNYAFMLINNIIWIIYAGQFGLMCWVCTLTNREFKKTGILIHSVIPNHEKTDRDKPLSILAICNEHDYSLQLHQQNQQHHDDRRRISLDISRFGLNYFSMENLLRANIERDCIRNEINDFSNQLQQQPIAFTACDFFEMNNALLTGFVGVITTYLIIVVQFYRPENV